MTTETKSKAKAERTRAERARDWFERLQKSSGRDELVALNRSAGASDAIVTGAAIPFLRAMGWSRDRGGDRYALAVAAAALVLSSVRIDTQGATLAWHCGGRRPEDCTVSPARWQRLIGTTTVEDLVPELRNALRLVDGEADVGNLCTTILDWEHPERGASVRRRWAYDYHHLTVATDDTN